jgi:hypothetical protein
MTEVKQMAAHGRSNCDCLLSLTPPSHLWFSLWIALAGCTQMITLQSTQCIARIVPCVDRLHYVHWLFAINSVTVVTPLFGLTSIMILSFPFFISHFQITYLSPWNMNALLTINFAMFLCFINPISWLLPKEFDIQTCDAMSCKISEMHTVRIFSANASFAQLSLPSWGQRQYVPPRYH